MESKVKNKTIEKNNHQKLTKKSIINNKKFIISLSLVFLSAIICAIIFNFHENIFTSKDARILNQENIFTSKDASIINLVKNRKLIDYPLKDIGATFEKAFNNGKWEVVYLSTGESRIQFSGDISASLHEKAVSRLREEVTEFQLQFHAYQNLDSERIQTITNNVKPKSKEADYLIVEDWITNKFWKVGSNYIFQWKIPQDDKRIIIERWFTLGEDVIEKEIMIKEVIKVIYSIDIGGKR
jgi:hypothetical protein